MATNFFCTHLYACDGKCSYYHHLELGTRSNNGVAAGDMDSIESQFHMTAADLATRMSTNDRKRALLLASIPPFPPIFPSEFSSLDAYATPVSLLATVPLQPVVYTSFDVANTNLLHYPISTPLQSPVKQLPDLAVLKDCLAKELQDTLDSFNTFEEILKNHQLRDNESADVKRLLLSAVGKVIDTNLNQLQLVR
jgi:hypothetical protein